LKNQRSRHTLKTLQTDKIFYLAVCIAALAAILSAPSAYAQDFTINTFHADIVVHKDSSFTVKETIEVQFHRSKHGIFRDIPFKYLDETGDTIRTPIDVISVTDTSGRELDYRITKEGNVIHIRIGDPDRYVSGHQTYAITYGVENAILFFHDHDELYWNVTGHYWWAPIENATAHVSLVGKVISRDIWAACYTGSYGSRESACGYETYENSAEFYARRRLNTKEGFTIAFGWDKGLVSPPSGWKKFLWAINMRENWVFSLPFLSLIAMLWLWNTKGRDPKVRETVTVMYEPPKHGDRPLIPAEAGTIIDEKVDSRDITSSIVGLAVKGYIRIEETKKEGLIRDSTDYYLAKIKEPDEELNPFEKLLMQHIFTGSLPGRMVSDLKNKFYANLPLLKDTLYGELVRKKYFLRSPDKIRGFYVAAGVVVAVAGFILALVLSSSSAGKSVLAGILSALPVFAFSKAMPAKTRKGALAYTHILGFQEFMERAEKDRLERMGDKDLFSKFLPYAIALDVVDNWARAFEGIYQEMPSWYVSSGGFRTFSPSMFSRSISSATSSMSSAMFSAPRSSGAGGGFSGGGGSSGGGFGGGGGGSW